MRKSRLRTGGLRGHDLQRLLQRLVLGQVRRPADLVGGGQQDGLVDLLEFALLHVDGLAGAGLVGHQESGGVGDSGGGLDLNADLVEGLLETREDGGVGPGGRDRVDADGEAGIYKDGVDAAGETQDGVFGGG